MSDTKINIELDESFITKLFELSDSLPPSMNDVNLQVLKKQLYDIGVNIKNMQTELDELRGKDSKSKKNKTKVQQDEQQLPSTVNKSNVLVSNEQEEQIVQSNTQQVTAVPMNYSQTTTQFILPDVIKHVDKKVYDDNGNLVKGRVLVIDDLGVITYQLSVIFKRAGYLPITSKEIYEAIDKFKRVSFDYVIMDLFIPTEREGFILLEELSKITKARNENTVIGVMSASTRKDHKQQCEKRGAAFYIEKVDDWQKELFNLVKQYAG